MIILYCFCCSFSYNDKWMCYNRQFSCLIYFRIPKNVTMWQRRQKDLWQKILGQINFWFFFIFTFFIQKKYFLYWWRCKIEDAVDWEGVSDSYLQTFGSNQETNSSLWSRWLFFCFSFCSCSQLWNNFQVSSLSVFSVVLILARSRNFFFSCQQEFATILSVINLATWTVRQAIDIHN
jgi:hypothetical protein